MAEPKEVGCVRIALVVRLVPLPGVAVPIGLVIVTLAVTIGTIEKLVTDSPTDTVLERFSV